MKPSWFCNQYLKICSRKWVSKKSHNVQGRKKWSFRNFALSISNGLFPNVKFYLRVQLNLRSIYLGKSRRIKERKSLSSLYKEVVFFLCWYVVFDAKLNKFSALFRPSFLPSARPARPAQAKQTEYIQYDL